ncbi:MAG: hypothetical protein IJX84_10645, partial [Clostridia bacterium]|nr:hypothetical protein [Clostridia bacterium]
RNNDSTMPVARFNREGCFMGSPRFLPQQFAGEKRGAYWKFAAGMAEKKASAEHVVQAEAF